MVNINNASGPWSPGYTPYSQNLGSADNFWNAPQSSFASSGNPAMSNPMVWGGVPYAPGQGGLNSQIIQPNPAGGGGFLGFDGVGDAISGIGSIANIGLGALSFFDNRKYMKEAMRMNRMEFQNKVKDYENYLVDRWSTKQAGAQKMGTTYDVTQDEFLADRGLPHGSTRESSSTPPASSQNTGLALFQGAG